MKKLSWNPKRRGETYCSTACGAKCSWSNYQEKKRLGNKMRSYMRNPKRWRVCIEENCHWYVFLEHIPTKGLLTVWPSHIVYGFNAMLSLTTPHCGDSEWSDGLKFPTPQAAVDHTVSLANRVCKQKMEALRKVCEDLGKPGFPKREKKR